jgi:hypothetical protein
MQLRKYISSHKDRPQPMVKYWERFTEISLRVTWANVRVFLSFVTRMIKCLLPKKENKNTGSVTYQKSKLAYHKLIIYVVLSSALKEFIRILIIINLCNSSANILGLTNASRCGISLNESGTDSVPFFGDLLMAQ